MVEREEAEAQLMATTTRAIAEDAERDLAEALPALDLAVACLSKLKKVGSCGVGVGVVASAGALCPAPVPCRAARSRGHVRVCMVLCVVYDAPLLARAYVLGCCDPVCRAHPLPGGH